MPMFWGAMMGWIATLIDSYVYLPVQRDSDHELGPRSPLYLYSEHYTENLRP